MSDGSYSPADGSEDDPLADDRAFVVGTIAGDEFEIPESEYDTYTAIASAEGMDLDEFIAALNECVQLFIAVSNAKRVILEWDAGADDALPSQDAVDDLATRLIEGQAALDGSYPFENFYAWLPGCAEQVQHMCQKLTEVLDQLDELDEVEERARSRDTGEDLQAEIVGQKAEIREVGWEIIGFEREFFEGIPIPATDPQGRVVEE